MVRAKHGKSNAVVFPYASPSSPTRVSQIPLNPHEIKGICDRLQGLDFDEATSTWPNRFIRKDARRVLLDSAQKQLLHMGVVEEGGKFRVGSKSETVHMRISIGAQDDA